MNSPKEFFFVNLDSFDRIEAIVLSKLGNYEHCSKVKRFICWRDHDHDYSLQCTIMLILNIQNNVEHKVV